MKSCKNRIDSSTLYSAMFSISYFKGFSLMRSKSIDETANILCNMCNKLKKDLAKGRTPYYQNLKESVATTDDIIGESTTTNELELKTDLESDVAISKNYCSVIKKHKKENITKENIGEIMLCQIPNVSSAIALAILKEFHTLPNLIEQIKQNSNCLNDICTTDANGKRRKISKTAISKIIEFLRE